MSPTGTAPHKRADWQRAAALASPQREELGVDDVIGAGVPARAKPGREANPRRRLRRCKRKQRSGNGKYGESPSHLAPLEALGPVLRAGVFVSVSFGKLRAAGARRAQRVTRVRGARARPQGVMLAARAGEPANVIEGTAEPMALPAPEAQSEPTPAAYSRAQAAQPRSQRSRRKDIGIGHMDKTLPEPRR